MALDSFLLGCLQYTKIYFNIIQLVFKFTIDVSQSAATTSLPETVNVCIGGSYIANAGSEWQNVTWASNTGFTGTGNTAEIKDQGKYYVSGYSIIGCLVLDTLSVVNPPVLTQTGLPETMTVCSGQVIQADPGEEWTGVTWTSDNGYSANNRIAELSNAGTYFISGYSNKGCLVLDTFKLAVSDNLLNAEFLMMSEAYAGDTIVIIEVSWPMAENCTWEIPEEATILNDHDIFKEIVFPEPGTYHVALTASLAQCSSATGKYIEILEPAGKKAEHEGTEGIPPLIESFTAYPNPAGYDINLDIKLSEEKDIRIEIISAGGNRLTYIADEHGLDNYLLNVDVSGLAKGVYIVRLVAGNEVKTKMIIVR